MTKQEAIPSENATIEDALNYFRNHCILCKSSNNCCNCEIGIAIECIEKQLPKKPVDVHHYGSGTSHIGGHCKCGFFVSKEMHNWCPKCGNKLEWSGNE